MSPFEIRIEEKPDFVIMHLSGSSTAVSKQDEEVLNLRERFKQLSSEGTDNVIVDLKNVEYIASDTIGALLSGNSILKKKGGKLVLCNASEYIQKIFEIVRLGEVLPIVDSLEDAEKEIKS